MKKSCANSGDQVREMIRSALHGTKDVNLLHRLDGVLLVAEGRSCGEVARWFGINRRTVERWIHAVGVQGIDGLVEHHPAGRPASLSGAQLHEVERALLAAPACLGYPDRRWTGKRLALHLVRRYGLALSMRSCQRLIARSRSGPPQIG